MFLFRVGRLDRERRCFEQRKDKLAGQVGGKCKANGFPCVLPAESRSPARQQGGVLGQIGSFVIGQIYPTLPVAAPWWAIIAAFTTALGAGVLFSVWPARRAAQLDPVMALARR